MAGGALAADIVEVILQEEGGVSHPDHVDELNVMKLVRLAKAGGRLSADVAAAEDPVAHRAAAGVAVELELGIVPSPATARPPAAGAVFMLTRPDRLTRSRSLLRQIAEVIGAEDAAAAVSVMFVETDARVLAGQCTGDGDVDEAAKDAARVLCASDSPGGLDPPPEEVVREARLSILASRRRSGGSAMMTLPSVLTVGSADRLLPETHEHFVDVYAHHAHVSGRSPR